MKNLPTAANNGRPEDHTTHPLGSTGLATRLQPVPAAPSDSEPAMGASAVRRTFTFTSSITGEKVTATCMPGCTIDHKAYNNRPEHPHDIYCNIPGTAGELPLYGPLCDTGSPEDFRFLSWQIQSHPFSGRPSERLPFVSIEAIDDHYIEYLDPDTLEMVISHLQKQVDSLREAQTQLVNVRTAYLNSPELAA
ncbi:hypothetical protein OTB20_12665 [Streptomyces sp. H27-H1]|uniref:DUF6907 domain-containing protein n=1 Tax=unclassified Streptomyces TaxID=2593676 RepID=UPI00227180C9|nr:MULTISPECIES: hypothetical protein [unclassified Streptomyces]MCY0927039.1 hypothetical protein [Streptomyces sp. H27-H1]MCY0933302.1 hypothetical protein [Streptomyces sp. H34-S4]